MFQHQWLEKIQETLANIKENYPNCEHEEKTEWRSQLQEIKKSCDHVLESWAMIEEQIAHLLKEHPELEDNEEEIGEEFWLDEDVVRKFRQGQGYYGLTMFKEAKQYFDKIVKEEPDFLLGRIYLGLSNFQDNCINEARQEFQIAVNTANDDHFKAFAIHMLGCIAVKDGDDREAIRQFRKVTDISPENEDAWFNLAVCHYRLGEHPEAIPYLFQAIYLNEDDWESMFYLSNCYRQYNEWETVTFWRLAAYEKKNHPEVLTSVAYDHEEMGQSEEAIYWYRRLLHVDPRNPIAYHGIAWNLWRLNKHSEAFLWIKRGLTLSPNDNDLLFAFIWMSLAVGNTKRALKSLEIVPEELRNQPMWLTIRCRMLTQIGEFDEAERISDVLKDEKKPYLQAMGHYQKGRTQLEVGEIVDAISSFQTAHKLVSDWKDPLFFEGVCHLIQGEPEWTKHCWGQIEQPK